MTSNSRSIARNPNAATDQAGRAIWWEICSRWVYIAGNDADEDEMDGSREDKKHEKDNDLDNENVDSQHQQHDQDELDNGDAESADGMDKDEDAKTVS
ncbi:MAG TPA: hypothetical protein ENK06_07655 [Gammaproteobacteria bacterium]|nr:hypothetical protein [Gammaproteobacteria bacterium]